MDDDRVKEIEERSDSLAREAERQERRDEIEEDA